MNRKITALKAQKNNLGRINVYLDGEFAFGLERILAFGLHIGQEFNEEKIAALKEKDACEVAYQRVLKFMGYRMRSETEISKYLWKCAVSDEITPVILERLRENGLLDDERFATNWIENRNEFRPRGRRILVQELRQKGIPEEVIAHSLDETPSDESLAYLAAVKQSRKYRDLAWDEYRRKLSGYLVRRGFPYEIISPVVSRVWSERQNNQSPEWITDEE